MLFNRVPWLEELLRLVPAFYALWIWLWGGKFSPFAYAGPGALITDRYAVEVQRGAVLGFQSALAGHMVVRDEAGRWVVITEGGSMTTPPATPYPIPASQNIIIAIAAIATSMLCLWAAAHAATWWGVAAAAVVFSFTNNLEPPQSS